MAKFKQKEQDIQNLPNPSDKKYAVSFKGNASIEIIIAGQLFKFKAHKTNQVFPEKFSNGIPESFVIHKDFQTMKKYFVVNELK